LVLRLDAAGATEIWNDLIAHIPEMRSHEADQAAGIVLATLAEHLDVTVVAQASDELLVLISNPNNFRGSDKTP
jgi:hypothetical protein